MGRGRGSHDDPPRRRSRAPDGPPAIKPPIGVSAPRRPGTAEKRTHPGDCAIHAPAVCAIISRASLSTCVVSGGRHDATACNSTCCRGTLRPQPDMRDSAGPSHGGMSGRQYKLLRTSSRDLFVPSWRGAMGIGSERAAGTVRSILIGMGFALATVAMAGPLEDGQAAYRTKDYTAALRLFQPLGDKGNAAGQNALGLMYVHGFGVPHDDAEALKWFRLAADQGFASRAK